MKSSCLKKKIGIAILSGCIGLNLNVLFQPVPVAHAADIFGMIGTAIQGAAAYKQVDATIKYYNNTDEGRQELFDSYQEKYGVSYNTYLEQQLDEMMPRLAQGISLSDPTVYDQPYLYFIKTPSTTLPS